MTGQTYEILVVDDDSSIQEIVRIILEKNGYRVHVATDGQEAVEHFRRVRPDLVVTDVAMPKGDGFNVAIAIRTLEKEKKVPILLMSAFYDEEANRENTLRCGADAFLSKPFTHKQLLDAVRTLLTGQCGP